MLSSEVNHEQRIQVYADPETRRRIGLVAAKHQMPVTEHCFEAIRQQLATEALTFAEGKGWELAHEFNRPRAYDTAYLALAQLLGCELWTADERLYNAVQGKLAWVKWVGHIDID